MVKISCQCGESFRIAEVYIPSKESITCQNCGQEMNKEVIEVLKEYIETKKQAEKLFTKLSNLCSVKPTKDDTFISKMLWSFTIEK
jgi:PHP family Zn ribbon phosphoesterase